MMQNKINWSWKTKKKETLQKLNARKQSYYEKPKKVLHKNDSLQTKFFMKNQKHTYLHYICILHTYTCMYACMHSYIPNIFTHVCIHTHIIHTNYIHMYAINTLHMKIHTYTYICMLHMKIHTHTHTHTHIYIYICFPLEAN